MALRADDIDLSRDRLLVEAWQSGDRAAFDDLYRLYFDRLRSFCQRRVGDAAEAEDLAQEAFTKALQALPRFAGDRRFYPWMTVIASRLCVDHHRRRRRVEPAADIDTGPVDDTSADRLVRQAELTDLGTALGRLGPRHQEVLSLREAESLSYHEIAERLSVPHSTVETLLFRARRALRREFESVTGGRLAGVPVIGWLALRITRVRERVSVAAPQLAPLGSALAASAVTAVLVATPMPSAPRPVTAITIQHPHAPGVAPDAGTPPPDAPAPELGSGGGGTNGYRSSGLPGVKPSSGEETRDRADDMTIHLDLGDTGIALDPTPAIEVAEDLTRSQQ